jgi:hypothetical protein
MLHTFNETASLRFISSELRWNYSKLKLDCMNEEILVTNGKVWLQGCIKVQYYDDGLAQCIY